MPYQTALSSSLAPDLVAMFTGVRPHPDVAAAEPLATVAGLAAAARRAAAVLGEPVSLSSADGRVAVAGAPGLAPGQVRFVAAALPQRRLLHGLPLQGGLDDQFAVTAKPRPGVR